MVCGTLIYGAVRVVTEQSAPVRLVFMGLTVTLARYCNVGELLPFFQRYFCDKTMKSAKRGSCPVSSCSICATSGPMFMA